MYMCLRFCRGVVVGHMADVENWPPKDMTCRILVFRGIIDYFLIFFVYTVYGIIRYHPPFGIRFNIIPWTNATGKFHREWIDTPFPIGGLLDTRCGIIWKKRTVAFFVFKMKLDRMQPIFTYQSSRQERNRNSPSAITIITLPETNTAPGRRPSQKETHLPTPVLQVLS